MWQIVMTPLAGARHSISTGLVPCPGAGGLWVFLHINPIPRATHTRAHTFQPGTVHAGLADSCSVLTKRTPRNTGERQNILPAYFNIHSHNKQLHLPPQAIACSVLINLPFIEFPHPSPNTSAPLGAAIKSVMAPHGHAGPVIVGGARGSHPGISERFDPTLALLGLGPREEGVRGGRGSRGRGTTQVGPAGRCAGEESSGQARGPRVAGGPPFCRCLGDAL